MFTLQNNFRAKIKILRFNKKNIARNYNMDIDLVLLSVILIILIITLAILNQSRNRDRDRETFSTDTYFPQMKENERHLDPHIFLNKHLSTGKLTAEEYNKSDPNFPRVKDLVKYDKPNNDVPRKNTDDRKPEFMSDKTGANINTIAGKDYYYDKKYLESAVDPEFLKDPQKYCNLYPEGYPCRRIPFL